LNSTEGTVVGVLGAAGDDSESAPRAIPKLRSAPSNHPTDKTNALREINSIAPPVWQSLQGARHDVP
jgi:hypothetical protein